MPALPDTDLQQLFLDARTHRHWQDKPVDDALLHRLYELARWAPTGGNINPMRVVFVRSAAAKEKLKPFVFPKNVDMMMNAPVSAIIAGDEAFYELIPKLTPGRDKSGFTSLPKELLDRAAYQGSSMQGAYLILAARALGLDAGPFGGFDRAKVDEAFFTGSPWKSNFILNLGYGDPAQVVPRQPRLSFEDACRVE